MVAWAVVVVVVVVVTALLALAAAVALLGLVLLRFSPIPSSAAHLLIYGSSLMVPLAARVVLPLPATVAAAVVVLGRAAGGRMSSTTRYLGRPTPTPSRPTEALAALVVTALVRALAATAAEAEAAAGPQGSTH